MAKPVVIGSRSFRTQKSALNHYKALLHRSRTESVSLTQGTTPTSWPSSNGMTRFLTRLVSRRRVVARSATSNGA